MLKRDRAQGVFTQTFAEFSNRMINDYRLKQGAANLKKYADVFARADQEFGVPGPVIAAFWGLETDFGAVQGDFNTLNALVTLAHDCRRPELFRPQIVPLLTLIDHGDLPADVTGAWAGEIGQTQMLPSDIKNRGVDGDGDGLVDVRKSAARRHPDHRKQDPVARLEARPAVAPGSADSRRTPLAGNRPHQQAATVKMGRMGRHQPATARRCRTTVLTPALFCQWVTRAQPS